VAILATWDVVGTLIFGHWRCWRMGLLPAAGVALSATVKTPDDFLIRIEEEPPSALLAVIVQELHLWFALRACRPRYQIIRP